MPRTETAKLRAEIEDLKKQVGDTEQSSDFTHLKGLSFRDFWKAIGSTKTELFDYQEELFNTLETHQYVWVKKATGLGISEFVLRYIAWKCITREDWKGIEDAQVCIVTGQGIQRATDLMRRLKGLFPDHQFKDKETKATINGVLVEAFPADHIDAMRALAHPRFIFIDEGDFFSKGQQSAARDASERYIGKTQGKVKIAMVSTPNNPGGMYDTIEREIDCIYHRVFLPYQIGLGKIYTLEGIEKAKKSPSFPREYELKYGYGIGNVFLPQQVDACEKIEYDPDKPVIKTPVSMGIDPAFGSSRFAFVVSRLANGRIEILEAEEHEKADFNDMVQRAMEFTLKHKIDKIFIDGSWPEGIRALKRLMGERIDYENVEYMKSMKVEPVNFNTDNKEMLTWAQQVVSEGQLAIHPRFTELLLQMRSARTNDKGALDKKDVSLDMVDALFLNLRRYHY